MALGKARASCIPCARRKVRCDKAQPCNHCRRRLHDKCEYPTSSSTSAANPRAQDLAKKVDRLQQYIRDLQVDLAQASSDSGSNNTSQPRRAQVLTPDTDDLSHDGSPPACPSNVEHTASALIEHDEEVSYIDTPTWFSWKSSGQSQKENKTTWPASGFSLCNEPRTLLNPPLSLQNSDAILPQLIDAPKLKALWKTFQTNVHPLLNIFYDWEVTILIERASQTPQDLGIDETALICSIILISTISMLPEDCLRLFSKEQTTILPEFQRACETALLLADYATTTNRLVFQAFLLYIITMNHRARPAAIFALMGICERIALRMGLHRDGEALGVNVFRSEERRRMWWQLQMQEIAVARNLGTIPLTLHGDWETRRPSNLEDSDLHPDLETLPPPRKKLTTISGSLWTYQILFMLREHKQTASRSNGVPWLLSPHVSLAEKEAVNDHIEETLNSMFLQHCDPLDPNHLYMQISIRQYTLASRRTTRQPALVNAKISEMSRDTRDEFLQFCVKSLEYLILAVTAPALERFRWFSCFQFQMLSLVYVLLEAHHRSDESSVDEIWDVVRRLYAAHPDLKSGKDNREFVFAAHLTLAAWQKRAVFLHNNSAESLAQPPWILEICENFNLPLPNINLTDANDVGGANDEFNGAFWMPPDFDFDMLDWSAWEDLAGPQ